MPTNDATAATTIKPALRSVDDALDTLLAAASALPLPALETVALEHAAGRVVAQNIYAPCAVPPHANSAMDGYAVRIVDVASGQALPISQRIAAGQVPQPLAAGTVARIFTGAPIPVGADAVIMQERAVVTEAGVNFETVPQPQENIRAVGEDIQHGQCLFSAGQRLSAADVGLLASVGIAQVPVRAALRVAIFFTGDELVTPGEPLPEGAIYNSNRYFLRPLLERLGCVVTDYGIVRDNLAQTQAMLERAAAEHEVIITAGGVSVGEEDHVKAAVQACGELDLWAIAVKPGKPLAFGKITKHPASTAHQAAFIGLPGNPVSAYVTFLLFARPYLLRRMGVQNVQPTGLPLSAAFAWPKADKRREFLRARINQNGQVELFPNQKSGVLTSCAWAEGLVDNAPSQTIAPGDLVRFIPLSALVN
ncbi:gephyrin-like molybdotransferase Glp [Parvibium lacunae]|uniref:molybdopterin molybdotransferase MoeA n=1 Tax=Parvibium lacunae TaxID=1888893 RepID=UPI0018652739|nr:gephyrin-like molybdotransferase Glp [Parvibium lacunae]